METFPDEKVITTEELENGYPIFPNLPTSQCKKPLWPYPESYKLNNLNKQIQLLREHIESFLTLTPPERQAIFAQAVGKAHKRVHKFYGLNNKYDGKGNRRT